MMTADDSARSGRRAFRQMMAVFEAKSREYLATFVLISFDRNIDD